MKRSDTVHLSILDYHVITESHSPRRIRVQEKEPERIAVFIGDVEEREMTPRLRGSMSLPRDLNKIGRTPGRVRKDHLC